MPRKVTGPVLKWAGGKRQLLPQILPLLLKAPIKTYYEPFVGGAAVFFELASRGAFERAVLSDRNKNLVEVYKALKLEPDDLIEELERYGRGHSEKKYYEVRDSAVPRSRAKRAARLIYLNKTGFNGLYRVNRSGQFNVPFGRYKNPKILDEPRLRAASAALAEVEIRVEDFEQACTRAKKGDAVYLDPPYLPVSPTAHFAAYHHEPFGIDEHRRLAEVFSALSKRGVVAVLSNSYTDETRRLFGAHRVEIVSARRSINSDHTRRGPVGEILVTHR